MSFRMESATTYLPLPLLNEVLERVAGNSTLDHTERGHDLKLKGEEERIS
tara:strand:+ start:1430 stop:1579 length:150 start_codon:yes stop_codon:yes gene_type:complete